MRLSLSLFYFILFALFNFNIGLYSQTTNLSASEYSYIYDEIQTYPFGSGGEEITLMIERRGLPLVNRLVRFISLTPDIFTFEEGASVIVVPTDENGKATAQVSVLSSGRGIAAMHMLFVGATGATNISYEVFSTINITEPVFIEIESSANVDKVNETASNILPHIIIPYLFLSIIAMFLISYFKRLTKEERSASSIVLIATMFGFNSIRRRFLFMIMFVVLQLLISGYMFIEHSSLVPVLLVTLCVSSYSIKKDRVYAICFLLFALLFLTTSMLDTLLDFKDIKIASVSHIASHNIFVFLVFVFFTVLFSSTYIPIAILTIYSKVFGLGTFGITLALLGILMGSLLYIVKYKYAKDLPIIYMINFLKIEE